MNKINYDLLMQDTIKTLEYKPKLLLHCCCAPCASTCIERLTKHFDITLYFYNPNIDTLEEYQKRAEELKRFASSFPHDNTLDVIICDYNKEEFYKNIKGLENQPERGLRCQKCYRLRLENTLLYAKNNSFDYFATTLTLSPLKSAVALNTIGEELSLNPQPKWLYTDFKKREGYKNSINLSNTYNLYRQNFCGCEFSKIR